MSWYIGNDFCEFMRLRIMYNRETHFIKYYHLRFFRRTLKKNQYYTNQISIVLYFIQNLLLLELPGGYLVMHTIEINFGKYII